MSIRLIDDTKRNRVVSSKHVMELDHLYDTYSYFMVDSLLNLRTHCNEQRPKATLELNFAWVATAFSATVKQRKSIT